MPLMESILLIGEKLNSSRAEAKRILEQRDEDALITLVREQIEGGAGYVDINAAMLLKAEREALRWGAFLARDRSGARVMLDSPDADLLLSLAAELGETCIVNSLSCDADLLDAALPVLAPSGAGIVVMLKDRAGVPSSIDDKMALAAKAAAAGRMAGIAPRRLFIDPVVMPLATTPAGPRATLDVLGELARRYPEHPRIVGLSNVSFGLPERAIVNRAFGAMCVSSGASALICDTTDRELVRMLEAADALAGRDAGCRRYLSSYRAGRSGA